MKLALAGLAIAVASLIAAPAAAALSADDAGRLAEVAFNLGGKTDHGEMNASTARWTGSRRFVWFFTQFAVGETTSGFAIFAVDRKTGAVWAVDVAKCFRIESPELDALRISLHLKVRASGPPAARYCHL